MNTNREEEDARYVANNKWIIYHFVMAIIVFTLPMALNVEEQTLITHVHMDILTIQKIIGLSLAYVIFLWTLIAIKIYPERDFSKFSITLG